MGIEEKELLLKDLCARLPYGVCVHTWYNKPLDIGCTGVDIYTNIIKLDLLKDDDAMVYIDNVKPYLRPLSSMTEEESKEYRMFIDYSYNDFTSESTPCVYVDKIENYINWLNSHHFDYHGLIEKGLALVAPKDMYNHD